MRDSLILKSQVFLFKFHENDNVLRFLVTARASELLKISGLFFILCKCKHKFSCNFYRTEITYYNLNHKNWKSCTCPFKFYTLKKYQRLGNFLFGSWFFYKKLYIEFKQRSAQIFDKITLRFWVHYLFISANSKLQRSSTSITDVSIIYR